MKPFDVAEQDSMSRSWSELPMATLTLIFEKLYLTDRAGTEDCLARVCSSWAEAAAAATRSIDLEECSDIDSLQQWLHSRGSSVRKLGLRKPSGMITSLPCPKLEDLELEESVVDLRPGSQLLQDLCAATDQTNLYFADIIFQDEPDLAAVLLALPNLKGFGLRNFSRVEYIKVQQSPQQQLLDTSTASEDQDSSAPSQQLWSPLGDPLGGYKTLTDSGMQFLCKLTKLQSLELGSLQGVTAAGLAGLADLPGLEDLTLEDLTCDITLTAVPAFSQLTALKRLTLRCETQPCEFDASLLAHMTQLGCLDLYCCTIARGKAGAAELLFRLSQLLQLNLLDLEYVESLQQCPPEAFSSLTSSSVLESLTLSAQLPDWDQPGPWQHMFPDTLRLTALTELITADAMPWEASDLDRLVSSCGALQELSLYCRPGLQLTPLVQLTALTRLLLAGATEGSTTASLVQLSALQGLQELLIIDPCCFTDYDAVRSLTALTQLTHLGLSDSDEVFSTTMQQQLLQHFDQEGVDGPEETCHIMVNTAPDGAPPDVWSQLLACCEACALLPAASDSE